MVTYLIAIAIGLVIFVIAVRVVRMLATPLPPEPDPEEVQEVDVAYKCTLCGLRLTVTHAQDVDAAAPRHCREDMVPV
jgi:hypothetical protein